MLACSAIIGINMFTHCACLTREPAIGCKARQTIREGRCSHQGRNVQFPVWKGARREVQRQRLLRSARYRTGQIRDAPASRCRQRVDHGRVERIWRIQADLLRGQDELRDGGRCRARTEKARTTWPPQDRRRRSCFFAGACEPRETGSRPGIGRGGSQRTRYRAPSPDDRAHIKKNGSVDVAAADISAPSSTVIEQYEALRSGALGEDIPVSARQGLVVLLRHGMWKWAQMMTAPPRPCPGHIAELSDIRPTHRDCSDLVHLLATIVTSLPERKVP
jgi:hypothetical protein